MKLFFKHLKNSIKRRPLQPLILILTLILASLVITSCIRVGLFINDEMDFKQSSTYGTADFTVTLNATSKSRFMFTSDVKEILKDKVKVAGVYELPMFFEETNQTAFGFATDFYSVEQIFTPTLVEYLPINQHEINESAIITQDFAQKFNVKLGDSFTANVLGYNKSYVVKGISETPLIGSYDIMVNIVGVMRLLATDSLLVSAIGDSFMPSSTLFVDVLDGYDALDCISKLKLEPNFADKSFALVSDVIQEITSLELFNVVVYVLIALSLLLCVSVVFCCFYILSDQRTQENSLFKALGAVPKQMHLLQYAEICIYWLIAVPIAIVLSLPMTKLICASVGFIYVKPTFSLFAVGVSALLTLIVSLLTTYTFILLERRPKKLKKELKLYRYLLPAFVPVFILTLLMPVKIKFILGCLGILILFFAVFTIVPNLIKWIFIAIDNYRHNKILKKGCSSAPSIDYAVKNVKNVKVLQNSCRLFVIILTVVCSVLVTIISANIVLKDYKTLLKGDFVVMNATTPCKEKIEKVDAVEDVYTILMQEVPFEDEAYIFLSMSSKEVVPDCELKELPKGNQVSVPVGLKERINIKLNDLIVINIGGANIELIVSEIRQDSVNMFIFDSEHFGISHDMLLVEGKDSVQKEKLRNELASALALEMATIVETEQVFNSIFSVGELYLNSGWFIIPIIILFAFIGMIDNVFISYRARKDEFELYNLSGMSKKDIRRMIFFELFITFALGVGISLISSTFSVMLIDQGLRTFGTRIFIALGLI